MSTNEMRNLNQSQPNINSKTADVTKTTISAEINEKSPHFFHQAVGYLQGQRRRQAYRQGQRRTKLRYQQQRQRKMEYFAATLGLSACIVYWFLVGCLWHVLLLSVNTVTENLFFMGHLGKHVSHHWRVVDGQRAAAGMKKKMSASGACLYPVYAKIKMLKKSTRITRIIHVIYQIYPYENYTWQSMLYYLNIECKTIGRGGAKPRERCKVEPSADAADDDAHLLLPGFLLTGLCIALQFPWFPSLSPSDRPASFVNHPSL